MKKFKYSGSLRAPMLAGVACLLTFGVSGQLHHTNRVAYSYPSNFVKFWKESAQNAEARRAAGRPMLPMAPQDQIFHDQRMALVKNHEQKLRVLGERFARSTTTEEKLAITAERRVLTEELNKGLRKVDDDRSKALAQKLSQPSGISSPVPPLSPANPIQEKPDRKERGLP